MILHDKVEYFQRAIPMDIDNLIIIKYKNTIWYMCIKSCANRPQL